MSKFELFKYRLYCIWWKIRRRIKWLRPKESEWGEWEMPYPSTFLRSAVECRLSTIAQERLNELRKELEKQEKL